MAKTRPEPRPSGGVFCWLPVFNILRQPMSARLDGHARPFLDTPSGVFARSARLTFEEAARILCGLFAKSR